MRLVHESVSCSVNLNLKICGLRIMWIIIVVQLFSIRASVSHEIEPNDFYNETSDSTIPVTETFNYISEDYSGTPVPHSGTMVVKHFYNKTINAIQLDIRWTNEKVMDTYEISIIPKSTGSICGHSLFNHKYTGMNSTYIIVPPEQHDFVLKGNCTYNIQYEEMDAIIGDIIIELPDCIDTKCNCDLYRPDLENLTINQVNLTQFNASWSVENRQLNNLTNVTFFYCDKSRANSTEQLVSFDLHDIKDNFVILDLNLTEGIYSMTASYYNNYSCEVFLSANPFEVPKPESWDWNLVFQIFLAVSITSFVIISLVCFFQKQTASMKYFLFNRFRGQRMDVSSLYRIPTSSDRRMENANLLYVDQEIHDGVADKYEFPRSRLILVKEIGKGAFGQVFLAKVLAGTHECQHVAAKTLRERATVEEIDDFLSEIQILKRIGEHPNIVTLIGCCTLKEPYMMIMEFVPCGDLKQYLLDLREKWHMRRSSIQDNSVFSNSECGSYIVPDSPASHLTTSTRPSVSTQMTSLSGAQTPRSPISENQFSFEVERVLDHTELQNFAYQIAMGMAHLEKIPITHRDLAARNILISEYKTLKISDFGLSRTGPYINNKLKKLPLRWMSIEAIEDHFYDNKSDVWAFAVVLWEIGTLGAFPYENIPDNMILYNLNNGKRLLRPEICTDELYSLMLRCWSQDPELRPSFEELIELLDVKRRRVYVDFSQLNPTYMFPPASEEASVKQKNNNTEFKYIECA